MNSCSLAFIVQPWRPRREHALSRAQIVARSATRQVVLQCSGCPFGSEASVEPLNRSDDGEADLAVDVIVAAHNNPRTPCVFLAPIWDTLPGYTKGPSPQALLLRRVVGSVTLQMPRTASPKAQVRRQQKLRELQKRKRLSSLRHRPASRPAVQRRRKRLSR